MVLEIAGKLFGQDDVRETESETTDVTPGDTSYYAIAAADFIPREPDVNDINYANLASNNDNVNCNADGIEFSVAVHLPHGATVTAVICYGDTASQAETWHLKRGDITDDSITEMATANFNTEDATITNPLIDNLNFKYVIKTSSMDTNDTIHGGRITFTT